MAAGCSQGPSHPAPVDGSPQALKYPSPPVNWALLAAPTEPPCLSAACSSHEWMSPPVGTRTMARSSLVVLKQILWKNDSRLCSGREIKPWPEQARDKECPLLEVPQLGRQPSDVFLLKKRARMWTEFQSPEEEKFPG